MSGVDPTEASMIALAHDTKHNVEASKDHEAGFVLEEKKAHSQTDSGSHDEEDEVYEGMPTEEEKQTLKRVPGAINFKAFLVGYIEVRFLSFPPFSRRLSHFPSIPPFFRPFSTFRPLPDLELTLLFLYSSPSASRTTIAPSLVLFSLFSLFSLF
jgi:hypothetical protein